MSSASESPADAEGVSVASRLQARGGCQGRLHVAAGLKPRITEGGNRIPFRFRIVIGDFRVPEDH